MLNNELRGFGNYFQSEAEANTLPMTQNSPQTVNRQLYAEQISGSAFTCPRKLNFNTWVYRIQPSVVHKPYQLFAPEPLFIEQTPADPNQMRYESFYQPTNETLSFIEGLIPVAQNECARTYLFQINQEDSHQFFINHEGEMLIVPQQGTLLFQTELGCLELTPGEIGVLPMGIKCQLMGQNCYGYICESRHSRFQLPNLGPIGANGLANPHDFIYPHANYHNQTGQYQVISLYQNHLWSLMQDYHPFNVVSWKGNYLPYKYNLRKFNTINTVSFDHPDPSIFTVLTAPSLSEGTANIDFVIFPDRWMVAEHTFRPPYFHRNIMSELMGLIEGKYDAKEDGFEPGGFSIHNQFTAHGPDSDTFRKARDQTLENERYQNTLAFMFECRQPWNVTKSIATASQKQGAYQQCWQELDNNFS